MCLGVDYAVDPIAMEIFSQMAHDIEQEKLRKKLRKERRMKSKKEKRNKRQTADVHGNYKTD